MPDPHVLPPPSDAAPVGMQPQSMLPVFETVLVVDDHPLFCEALCVTLRSMVSDAPIAVTGTLAEALIHSRQTETDLVLLDLNLPDVDSLEGVVQMRAAAPKAALLVISSMSDDAMISGVLRAGADGFVPKHADRQTFAAAITVVCQGGHYVPIGYVEPRKPIAADDVLTRMATLTQQQSRILMLICQGKLNKQIAYDLSIAETTVKAHVTAIMRKLGVQSRTQAVLIAQGTRFEQVLPSDSATTYPEPK